MSGCPKRFVGCGFRFVDLENVKYDSVFFFWKSAPLILLQQELIANAEAAGHNIVIRE